MDLSTPKSSEIQFKPVHKGLGFHPFSEGLPYAPNSPSTGATVAGPIRIAPPVVPLAPTTPLIRGKPLAQLPVQPEAVEPLEQEKFGLGYLMLRLLAFFTDSIAHFAFSLLVLFGVMSFLGHELLVLFEPGVIEFALLFAISLSWALVVAQEVVLGSTPGKRMVGLRLNGSAAAIFMRSFFFIPSVLFMGLGILWALFNRNRRCWHDLAADVQPVRARR